MGGEPGVTPRRPRPPTLFDDPDDQPEREREPFDVDAYLERIAKWKPYAIRRPAADDDHDDDDLDWRQR